jgi:hypothetical protein
MAGCKTSMPFNSLLYLCIELMEDEIIKESIIPSGNKKAAMLIINL